MSFFILATGQRQNSEWKSFETAFQNLHRVDLSFPPLQVGLYSASASSPPAVYEAANGDTIAAGDGFHNKGQKAVNDGLGFDSGQTDAIGKFVDQFLFGHCATQKQLSVKVGRTRRLTVGQSEYRREKLV